MSDENDEKWVVIRRGVLVYTMPLAKASPLSRWGDSKITICDSEAEAREEASYGEEAKR